MKKTLWTSASLFSLQSYAALPAEVTQTFTSVTADIKTVGALLVGLAAISLGFRWLKAMFF